ncbi:M6 family metalloprotease domain-containing protein [Pochonia chlamydosporia 170]|uniref:M6 family metalloprotease domain-containing protein n=1 Tax=Pochonia chlamydosporia 170 TaxID=1380566 RepID=A0A179G7R7_METCM|nr:M6 family metalloprotease domain-containing protein [Pochonia chlamydosporia 170]OAQ73550.1 M6 family metalloprotease domain-containing protein [Pochonia chlamydosporia 170]
MWSKSPSPAVLATVVAALLGQASDAAAPSGDPFKVIDPQHWVNPDNMTWADFKAPPGTKWNDPSKKGQARNFNIALVTIDYNDMNFTITGPPNSTIFGTPTAEAANIPRKDVPAWYRDFLNKPGDLNRGHTLHEYWMEDSHGRYGVDLTSFGPYRMPSLSWQYGIDNRFNPGACPPGTRCSLDIRGDALNLWKNEVGNDTASKFELVFLLSAGQDESSTWQEFGEMKFNSKEDVPDSFGPPKNVGNATLPNYATTRYVPWTSWAAASAFWPNAGGGSSVQCESSGMATFAHELSHLLNIADNYNNPYGTPLRRAFTGPWSMLSRGSFNGPGGPHTRWQVPPVQGASMGSLHTVRDKLQIGLIDESSIVRIPRKNLRTTGPLVTTITARSVVSDRIGVRILLDKDMSPKCDVNTDLYCDGGGYNNYEMEVVDRMGADSFQGDAGVMISKTKNEDDQPFQWTIDANPQDIKLRDFIRPNGTEAMITMGDYRQLLDALFHAGTRSGSKPEYKDEPNGLHFYVLEKMRDESGVLSYTVGARALNSTNKSKFSVKLSEGRPESGGNSPTSKGIFCSFDLTNDGKYTKGCGNTPVLDKNLGYDIYRLEAQVKGKGWRTEVPNALVAAKFGEKIQVNIAVGATSNADDVGVVTMTAISESDPKARTTATCEVRKA